MMNASLTGCKVKGWGEIFTENKSKGVHFSIIEMSADDIRILSTDELENNANVRMKIHLPSFLFQVNIKVVGKIYSKTKVDNGFIYDLKFVGLPDNDRKEIDELVKSACGQVGEQ